MPKIIDDRPAHMDSDAPTDSEQLARQQTIEQIKARRRFKISTASAALGVTLLVPIWATTEYRNAGGLPTHGFSQRSGSKVWNVWIIYPFLAYALITAGHGWFVYGRKPIPESEIRRRLWPGECARSRGLMARKINNWLAEGLGRAAQTALTCKNVAGAGDENRTRTISLRIRRIRAGSGPLTGQDRAPPVPGTDHCYRG
jgi:hypothetical protein